MDPEKVFEAFTDAATKKKWDKLRAVHGLSLYHLVVCKLFGCAWDALKD